MTRDPITTLRCVNDLLGDAIFAALSRAQESEHAAMVCEAIGDMSNREWKAIILSVLDELGVPQALEAKTKPAAEQPKKKAAAVSVSSARPPTVVKQPRITEPLKIERESTPEALGDNIVRSDEEERVTSE